MAPSLDPVSVLHAEHRCILLVLGKAEDECEQVLRGAPMERVFFQAAIDFLLQYVDGAHSEKEVALFSELAPDGLETAPRVVQRLVQSHRLAHTSALTLRGLAVSLEGGVYSPRKIAEALLRYANQFREHAHQEETAVFPLARRFLPPQALETVLHRFAAIAAERAPMEEVALALCQPTGGAQSRANR